MLFSAVHRFCQTHFGRVINHLQLNFLQRWIFRNRMIAYILAQTQLFIRGTTRHLHLHTSSITQAISTYLRELAEAFEELGHMYDQAFLKICEGILTLDTETFEAVRVGGDSDPGYHLWMWLYWFIGILLLAKVLFPFVEWWMRNAFEAGNVVGADGVDGNGLVDMRMEARRCLRFPSFWRGVDDRLNWRGWTWRWLKGRWR